MRAIGKGRKEKQLRLKNTAGLVRVKSENRDEGQNCQNKKRKRHSEGKECFVTHAKPFEPPRNTTVLRQMTELREVRTSQGYFGEKTKL